MLRAILFLVQVAIVVAVVVWLADRPGRVAIEWQGYLVDTSVGVLAAVVVAVAVATALLYTLYRALRRAPRNYVRYRRGRRRERGYRALTLGMVAVAAGAPEEARRQSRRADVLLDEPPLTMLLAAQSAQLDGDDEAARRYFTQMLDRPETAFLGMRGLLMQARRAGRPDEALALAERADRLRPGTPWVLEAMFDLQVREAQWGDAERTLESLERHKLVDKPAARHRRAVLRLERSRAARARGDAGRALHLAREARKLDPDLVPAAADLVRLEQAAGQPRRLEKAMRGAWARHPHPALAQAYIEALSGLSPLDRYRRLQRIAAASADHRESRLALAEAALAAKLWGEARSHLAPLLEPNPSAQVCRLMAEIESEEHDDANAAREWLARAADAPPDPAWVCGACGNVVAEWSADCPACGAFDRLEWRVPAHAAAPALHGPRHLPQPARGLPPGPPVGDEAAAAS